MHQINHFIFIISDFDRIRTLTLHKPTRLETSAPKILTHIRAQLDWVSSGGPIPLINGSGSKFEDNLTELFNRVTVK